MNRWRGWLLAVVMAVALGCSQGHEAPGTWTAKDGDSLVHLTLNQDGKGVWATEDDEVPLTWEVKKGEVWLHTKSGGVLPARIGEDAVMRVDLPGVGTLEFRQTK